MAGGGCGGEWGVVGGAEVAFEPDDLEAEGHGSGRRGRGPGVEMDGGRTTDVGGREEETSAVAMGVGWGMGRGCW